MQVQILPLPSNIVVKAGITMISYNFFKNFVLKESNGKNIHKINSLLGIIMNQKENEYYYKSVDVDNEEKAKESLERGKKAFVELRKLVLIPFEYEAIKSNKEY